MHNALVAGWTLTLVGLALPSCSASSSAFACSTDAECSQGVCQPVGYCSFPDAECFSGQRFGEFAHPDFANVCVDPPAGGTASPTVGDAGMGPGGAGSGPPSGSTGSPSTSSNPDATTIAGSAEGGASDDSMSGSGHNPLNEDADLIAWYEFESDPADGVRDSSVHGLDGVCIEGNCPSLEKGVIGRAIHLDGVDDAIVVDMSAMFDTPGGWTIGAWLRRDAEADNLRMAFGRQFGGGSRNTYEVYFHDWQGDGPVLMHLGITGEDGAEARISTMAAPPIEDWFHVVGRWDGETISLWVDGAIVSDRMVSATLFDDHNLLIGVDQNGDNPVSNHFNGSIDDLRIYGRALSGDEIRILADPNGTP